MRLSIPDPLATDLANLGQWDYRSDVPVTVLGHIFEQSITDIESVRGLYARGEEPPQGLEKQAAGHTFTPRKSSRAFWSSERIDVSLEVTLRHATDQAR